MEDTPADITSVFRDKYVRLAREMDLFKGLNPDELLAIMSTGMSEAAAKGTVIFSKGSPGTKMYVILEGEVEIIHNDKVIGTLGKGEMFGEMGLLSRKPRSATVVAKEASSFFILTEESLHKLFSKRVAIVLLLNVIGKLGDRLRQADEVLGEQE